MSGPVPLTPFALNSPPVEQGYSSAGDVDKSPLTHRPNRRIDLPDSGTRTINPVPRTSRLRTPPPRGSDDRVRDPESKGRHWTRDCVRGSRVGSSTLPRVDSTGVSYTGSHRPHTLGRGVHSRVRHGGIRRTRDFSLPSRWDGSQCIRLSSRRSGSRLLTSVVVSSCPSRRLTSCPRDTCVSTDTCTDVDDGEREKVREELSKRCCNLFVSGRVEKVFGV